jgi:hypothetical protein
MRGVQFPGHRNGKVAMVKHRDMLWDYRTDGCHPCHNGIALKPQTHWWCKGTGTHPPDLLRQATPDPMPHPPRTSSLPPGGNLGGHTSEIEVVPPCYLYIHNALHCAELFNHDESPKDRNRDRHFNPDMLTDEGSSTG